jgi:hypothetical protein
MERSYQNWMSNISVEVFDQFECDGGTRLSSRHDIHYWIGLRREEVYGTKYFDGFVRIH